VVGGRTIRELGVSARVVQVGLDRRCASVAVLGEVHRQLRSRGNDVVGGGLKAVSLTTCHRIEVYLEDVPPQTGAEAFLAWTGFAADRRPDLLPLLTIRAGDEAARHLFRVASGLESAVLGEDQVLGQVREAYRRACAARTPGPILHRLFHGAFRTGKRVRNETELGGGGRSLAGSGVNVLSRVLGGLQSRSVLVLGAGEMGSLAARRLRQRGVGRLLLANRSRDRGVDLAREVGAQILPWDWRRRVLREVDGIVCATGSPEPVIPCAWLEEAVGGGGILRCVVDLAVPPNVEIPPALPRSVVVANVDTIARHLADEDSRRRAAIMAAEGIVEEEVQEWLARVGRGEEWRARKVGSVRENLAG
jgi:glutamyl-tRNA reductase